MSAEDRQNQREELELLRNDADRELYLNVVLEDADAPVVAMGLGAVARAVGTGKIAKRAGLSAKALDRALSGKGTLKMDTVFSVLDALGYGLVVSRKSAPKTVKAVKKAVKAKSKGQQKSVSAPRRKR